jgi:hypothetical protein
MITGQTHAPAAADRFRAAMEQGSARGLGEVLDANVAFYSPAFAEPTVGREPVAAVLATAREIYGDLRFEQQLTQDTTTALFFTADVDGHRLQGCYRIVVSPEDTVVRLDALMRPIDAAQTLVATMMNRIAQGGPA